MGESQVVIEGRGFLLRIKKKLRNKSLSCCALMKHWTSSNSLDQIPASLCLRIFYTRQVTTFHSSHTGLVLLDTAGITDVLYMGSMHTAVAGHVPDTAPTGKQFGL